MNNVKELEKIIKDLKTIVATKKKRAVEDQKEIKGLEQLVSTMETLHKDLKKARRGNV